MSEYGEYKEIRELVNELGGSMEFFPGGGPGGVWQIELRGRIAQVECRNHTVNDLDAAYVPNTVRPSTWDDFDEPYTLKQDAFWHLVEAVRRNEVAPEEARTCGHHPTSRGLAEALTSPTWIEPFRGRGCSLGGRLNFLWRHGDCFIMDNHLAAAWCWAQHLGTAEPHSVLHIDAHYDIAPALRPEFSDVPDIRSMSWPDYRSLSYRGHPHIEMFRWDNYISLYQLHYGHQVEDWYFATHRIGAEPPFDVHHLEPERLASFLNDETDVSRNWILNLDVDYFRSPSGDRMSKPGRESVLAGLGRLKKSAARAVVTIALSPECCGSWAEAEDLCSEVCLALELPFALPAAKTAVASDRL